MRAGSATIIVTSLMASLVYKKLLLALFVEAMYSSKAEAAVTGILHRSLFSALLNSDSSFSRYRSCPMTAVRRITMDAHVDTSISILDDTSDTVKVEKTDKDAVNIFVPTAMPTRDEIEKLVHFVRNCSSLIAITGAGISTSSGIPDYRGPNGSYRRGHKPMLHSEFMNSELNRKRYWARSMVGFVDFNSARPNDAHVSLAQLESSSILKHIITQNVDRLHSKAGSQAVTDIHGRIDRVRCQNPSCNSVTSRRILQQALAGLNPAFTDTYFNNDAMVRRLLCTCVCVCISSIPLIGS